VARYKYGSKRAKKGDRKHGRCRRKPANKRYAAERRWEKAKARNVERMRRKFPNYRP
jgi:hypothetical protein